MLIRIVESATYDVYAISLLVLDTEGSLRHRTQNMQLRRDPTGSLCCLCRRFMLFMLFVRAGVEGSWLRAPFAERAQTRFLATEDSSTLTSLV